MTELDALKTRARFYKAGAIIPRNILKCSKRKFQHLVKFGTDTWALPGVNGWVCFQHHDAWSCAIRLSKATGNLNFAGSPYFAGPSVWIGDSGLTAEQFLVNVKRVLRR